MLRVVAHKSAAAARQYYAEGLKREDYYSEGQEVVGEWHGKAADKLGLSGKVDSKAFAALAENRHPGTGRQLTPRQKSDRIVGYDINFHAPKSLSVLQALTGDKEIVKAFRSAVAETMAEIEILATTRIRQRGAQDNRATGNLAWAEFVHFTARPVGGIPDPHLHVHCFVFNATYDDAEKRWKAAKFRQIKQEAPYNEAAFHARLAAKLSAIGYGIRRTSAGWEIDGISRAIIDKFSRRTAQIDRLADEKGITDAKLKDALGAATREGKRRGLTYPDMLAAWGVRLTDQEKVEISKARYEKSEKPPAQKITAIAAVDYAFEKLFAKNSVVEQNRLVLEALRYGVGHIKPDQVWREVGRRELLVRKIGDEILCTSVAVLAEEVALINFVRSGRGNCASIQSGDITFSNDKLSGEQKAAVRHILKSRDQVIAVRGGAGVGKTTLMSEAATQVEATGRKIFAFAPSAAASRETLREAGFSNANTVAHLLQNAKLQKETRGQVIWIDEAGLLGIRELAEIMRIAGTSTRIILTGDSGQHSPVARGDAFRLLQKFSGLKIAEVKEVRRQEHEMYRDAVRSLSRGDMSTAFQKLDDLGAIVEEQGEGARYALLAKDFMALSKKGVPPLVVSPTHAESERVTSAIREAKTVAGQIKGERSFIRYHDLRWENADKKRPENFCAGLVIQFHQNAPEIRRGEILRVVETGSGGKIQAENSSGKKVFVPLKHAERFQVFEEREIRLGKGDQIRITRNGESLNGKRLNNGNTATVEKLKRNGDIVLNNGAILDRKHGHFTYGYCQTSHSSQSKSVRDVLVAQSSDSFVASSKEQFYVSVSRGKQSIRIYTDNRRVLQEAVGNTSTRQAGVELARLKPKDISAMDKLTSRQFRDAIKSRHEHGEKKSHVQALLKERKQDSFKKPQDHSWKQYIEMRRGLVGSDGRSRSKGQPQAPNKKGGNAEKRQRSFARPTQMTNPVTERMLAAHAKKHEPAMPGKKPADPRIERAVTAREAGAKHFTQAVSKARDGEMKKADGIPVKTKVGEAKKPPSEGQQAMKPQKQAQQKPEQAPKQKAAPLPQSTAKQSAEHNARQKAADAAKAVQQQAKVVAEVKQAARQAAVVPQTGPRK